MQLVWKPQQFDVMGILNVYGNVTTHIGAALDGEPGMVPGCNSCQEYAMHEPGCRHVAKDVMGAGVVDPTAVVLSAVMLRQTFGKDG
ncbi:isocitrate dehydrogenase (NAD(+)) idh1 [Tilletia horrida]|nr:isocitrate dehydrogenase (NAD(+)) idh1 [Tilletia horrida]